MQKNTVSGSYDKSGTAYEKNIKYLRRETAIGQK